MNSPQSIKDFEHEKLFEFGDFTAQLCCSPESQKLAFELRYRAYRHVNAIPEHFECMFHDSHDFKPNSRSHLLWYEGKPVASIRSSIWSDQYNWETTEGLETFWAQAHRRIGLEKRVLESSRFAIVPELTGRKSITAQLLLFRVQDLSAQVEECPYIITSVREKHVNFYKRMLAFEQISEAVRHDDIDAEIVLLLTTQQNSREVVTSKGMPKCEAYEVDRYQHLLQTLNQTSHAVSDA